MKSFFVIFFTIWTVFWSYTSYLITTQSSTNIWAYDSVVSFTWEAGKEWYYVNNDDNSAIITNYFSWYYYDSVYWYFKLDWSSDNTENVRIIWSTSMCNSWYWYKLWWKAYSELSGYIDFNYNLSTFVYYCLDDGKLHWQSYWRYIGYQDFEWIEIWVVTNIVDLIEKVSSALFTNDTTDIEKSTTVNNEDIETLWWDLIQIDDKKESLFYIIK